MESIKQILMRRDNMSEFDADNYMEEANEEFKQLLKEGNMEELESFTENWFGLEPDYLDEMMLNALPY